MQATGCASRQRRPADARKLCLIPVDSNDFIDSLKKRWRTLAAFVGGALVLALLVSLLSPTTYKATARLFVAVTSQAAQSQNQGNLLANSDFLKAQVQSFTELATSPQVLGQSVRRRSSSIPASAIEATNPTGTFLIDVTGSGSSGRIAAARANFVAGRMRAYIPSVATKVQINRPSFALSVVKPAGLPTSPSSPRWVVNLIVGLLLGLAVGLAFILIRGQMESDGGSSAQRPRANAPEPDSGSSAGDAAA